MRAAGTLRMIPVPTPTALLFIFYILHIYLQLIVYLCNFMCVQLFTLTILIAC
jgi:hypothetical protein